MSQPIRVVHFLNQFFAGVGGEEQANLPVEVREGAVGPGRALQAALGDSGQVVATIVSGDNYFTEESAASARAVTDALSKFQPDVVVPGRRSMLADTGWRAARCACWPTPKAFRP